MTNCNPYEDLYRSQVNKVTSAFSMKQAEQMATHMSLLYNAFGTILKDMVGLMSLLYEPKKVENQLGVDQAQKQYHKDMKQMQKKVEKQYSNCSSSSKINEQNNQKQPDFNKYMLNVNEKLSKDTRRDERTKTNLRNKNTSMFESKEENKMKSTVQRIQVVRGKKERQGLNGYTCTMCADFYKALGQDYSDSNGTNKLCNDCSRHRSNLPPTVFNMDFSQEFGFDD